MDMNRIEQAIENKVISEIQSGHVLKFEYGFMDATPWMEKALMLEGVIYVKRTCN